MTSGRKKLSMEHASCPRRLAGTNVDRTTINLPAGMRMSFRLVVDPANGFPFVDHRHSFSDGEAPSRITFFKENKSGNVPQSRIAFRLERDQRAWCALYWPDIR